MRCTDDGLFRPGAAILDIGASELDCAREPGKINEFLTHYGAAQYSPEELGRIITEKEFARRTMLRAGFRYQAVDYSNYPDVLRLDLNRQGLPASEAGKYQLVINAGTTEHILNQLNCFDLIHKACAQGGLMYHGVPFGGDFEHGLINYNPKFFWALAVANHYDVVRFWGWASGELHALPDSFQKQIAFNAPPMAHRAWLHVLLRKTSTAPFEVLNDPAFNASWTRPGQA